LTTQERGIDVENIFPNGFDYQGHLKCPGRRSLEDRSLVAEIYNSAGNEFFEKAEFDRAVSSYEMAVGMDPSHDRAPLNILMVEDKIARERNQRAK
jgi:hypothetical protein